jgi:hypothetical protein
MAVSLGFGVVFATFITLVIVPSLYLILEDVKIATLRFFGRDPHKSGDTTMATAAESTPVGGRD